MKWEPRWKTGRQTHITEIIGPFRDNTKAFHPFFTEDKISNYPAIVFCCYLQCLQLGYRQIIKTLTTLHQITITHRHCVERGHYIIISHVSFRLEFCLKFIYISIQFYELLLKMFVSSSLILLSDIPSVVPEKSASFASYFVQNISRNLAWKL